MTPWIATQILIDLLLLVTVVICFSRLKKVVFLKQEADKRVEELLEVQGSINALLRESLEVSSNISREIEKERTLAEEVIDAFDAEKKTLSLLAQELKSELTALREEMGKYDILSGKIIKDKYSEAIKLAETGLSAEEIAKKTGIPLGEIELALSLRK